MVLFSLAKTTAEPGFPFLGHWLVAAELGWTRERKKERKNRERKINRRKKEKEKSGRRKREKKVRER